MRSLPTHAVRVTPARSQRKANPSTPLPHVAAEAMRERLLMERLNALCDCWTRTR